MTKSYTLKDLKLIYYSQYSNDFLYKIEFIKNYWKLSLNIESKNYHKKLKSFQSFFNISFATYTYFDNKENLLKCLEEFDINIYPLKDKISEYHTSDDKYHIYYQDKKFQVICSENYYRTLNLEDTYLEHYLKFYFSYKSSSKFKSSNINKAIEKFETNFRNI